MTANIAAIPSFEAIDINLLGTVAGGQGPAPAQPPPTLAERVERVGDHMARFGTIGGLGGAGIGAIAGSPGGPPGAATGAGIGGAIGGLGGLAFGLGWGIGEQVFGNGGRR